MDAGELRISRAGGVVVPIYPTNSPSECKWVIGNSEARAVICEDGDQLAKIDQMRDELPSLEHVIMIDKDRRAEHRRPRASRNCASAAGAATREQLRARTEAIGPARRVHDHLHVGHDRPPKGVVLTHANAMSVCQMVEEIAFVEPGETTYLYLPLAHAFALTSQLASFDQGTTIVYYSGDTKKIVEEILGTHPTYLPSVPRIFEKIYTMAMNMQAQASEEDQKRFKQAIKLGVEVRQPPAAGRRGARGHDGRLPAGRRADLRARAGAVRQPGPPGGQRRGAHRARRSSSSSTPPACPCSRAGA